MIHSYSEVVKSKPNASKYAGQLNGRTSSFKLPISWDINQSLIRP